jgi:hypothetical protein
MDSSKSGARTGGSDDDDGPRSPPESALTAGEDRSLRAPQRLAVEVGHRCLTDDHRAALPLSQTSVNRVTDRADPLAGSGAGTVAAQQSFVTRR